MQKVGWRHTVRIIRRMGRVGSGLVVGERNKRVAAHVYIFGRYTVHHVLVLVLGNSFCCTPGLYTESYTVW
jgi:hypothetical protein